MYFYSSLPHRFDVQPLQTLCPRRMAVRQDVIAFLPTRYVRSLFDQCWADFLYAFGVKE